MYTLIKKTLEELHKSDIDATPKNYAKEFYHQADQLNLNIEDKERLDEIIRSLTDLEKTLIKNNKINTATELVEILKDRVSESEILSFVTHITEFLKPSIDQKVFKDVEKLVDDLKQNPKLLTAEATLKKIARITENRIKCDREALVHKSDDMKKLTTLLSKYYDKSLIQSCNTSEEIGEIKQEIETLNLSEHSAREITSLQKQLVDTIFKLENSIEKNKMDLIKGQDECNMFEQKIKELQIELSEVKKEKNIDYLTGVLNRRGFESESTKIENAFNMFDSKYAVIFFDIDDFKKVNDKYGHDCGDVILKTFGTILNKLTREDDIIARYGGEEFVSLLHYNDEEEIKRYSQRVKEIITHNKFVYKDDIKIKLKFSAGISFRTRYDSAKEAIKKADLLLYKAKSEGKDQIIFDNGLVV